MNTVLNVEKLTKNYKKKGRESVCAVDNVSFSGFGNEILGILGPNGSGKTTIVKSIASLINYDSGSIEFQGRSKPKHLLDNLGAVLEGARNIHWKLTPYENFKYYAGIKGIPLSKIQSNVDELMGRLDLGKYKDKLTGQLSRGNQQKVALACAMLANPDLLLLDEPTLGLDVETTMTLKSFFREIIHEDRLILITSHDMRLIESICDRVLIIKDGKKLTEEKVSGLKRFFQKKAICISVEKHLPETVKSRLGTDFHFSVNDNGDTENINGIIDNNNDIYRIMDLLKENGVQIADIHINDNDFESIFMEIINQGKKHDFTGDTE
ncbi:MAG: ABC transporter ATP-binding protein [Spirochaetales bacterium]|nr:ABC transporter ATP-binding protein [Spirochaetales bacterium]